MSLDIDFYDSARIMNSYGLGALPVHSRIFGLAAGLVQYKYMPDVNLKVQCRSLFLRCFAS